MHNSGAPHTLAPRLPWELYSLAPHRESVMHARDLIHLAAQAAAHAPTWLLQEWPLAAGSCERYAAAIKARSDLWERSLSQYARQAERASAEEIHQAWRALRPTVDEILASDLVVRVWGALLCTHDACHAGDPAIGSAALAEYALGRQVGASQRLLELIVQGPGVRLEQAAAINRLRHACERWTDLLISGVVSAAEEDLRNPLADYLEEPAPANVALRFACDGERAAEFARDWPRDLRSRARAADLWLAALNTSMADNLTQPSPHPQLNADVAAGLLLTCGADLFDGSGVLVTARVSAAAGDTRPRTSVRGGRLPNAPAEKRRRF